MPQEEEKPTKPAIRAYKYPLTGEKYFGMRERSNQILDPKSPTVKRESEIQSRGGAYSDRIFRRAQPRRTQRA